MSLFISLEWRKRRFWRLNLPVEVGGGGGFSGEFGGGGFQGWFSRAGKKTDYYTIIKKLQFALFFIIIYFLAQNR
jgi:hypothetical protein